MELAVKLVWAIEVGDEVAVRQLLAEGAKPDQATDDGWLPLHFASYCGHAGVVRLLLEAAPPTSLAVESYGWTPLHFATECGNIEVMKLLLSAAPAAAAVLSTNKLAPIHAAALSSNAAAVQLLLEAAPELPFAQDDLGETPLHKALRYRFDHPAEQVTETARCPLPAAPAVQPGLEDLLLYGQTSATLFADLVARLPLSQEQWRSIPAPCPDLARALPAVLQRSESEAGWLVGRLTEGQRATLRAVALSLAQAQQHSSTVLPAELSGRILALCLLDP